MIKNVVLPSELTVSFAGKSYVVCSVLDAAKKWSTFRDATGAGVSEIGNGVEVRDGIGALVASISYNGRIWLPDGSEFVDVT